MNPNLDRRIKIFRKTAGKDSTYGSQTFTRALLATVWAERQDEAPSRVESVRNGLEQSRNRVRYRIRYRADVDSSMEIEDEGDVMLIVGGPAMIGGRREYLEFYCERSSNQGA